MIDDDDFEEDEDLDETEDDSDDIEAESSDNVGDPSVEINVEALIHELESQGLAKKIDREQSTRRRLEELMERKRTSMDLEDFDDYKI